jgi:hypothetical protein
MCSIFVTLTLSVLLIYKILVSSYCFITSSICHIITSIPFQQFHLLSHCLILK